jgi:hypothetical protein
MRSQRMFGTPNIIGYVSFDNSNMFYFRAMVGLDIEGVREFREARYRFRHQPASGAQGAVDIAAPPLAK